ncbi:chemotaxis response regulator protein-glutamate methylesterase [Firmicutes bacterium CAG:882]|jgi:two-component system chemotaxis response regulator CheB|nr:chemotaxis response regulator protein-glutamate methylesterase [Firmicutes bacterium CAG:882]
MAKKILIIDDSALMRRVISDIIKTNKQYEVADFATDGLDGFDKIVSHPKLYDAIILDINMPKMNGLELLEMLQKNRIQETVIVVSTVAKEGAKETIKALELGAFDFVTKPENFIEAKGENFKQRILDMLEVATASSTKASVISSMPITQSINTKATTMRTFVTAKNERSTEVSGRTKVQPAMTVRMSDHNLYKKDKVNRIVALACSTGGPKSLQQVIPYLPADMDAGMVVVQHMPAGFTKSLAMRLNEISKVKVKEAEDGDIVEKGTVYIAPGGRHMRLTRAGSTAKVVLSDEPPVDALRPCANVMYESLKDSPYDEIVCVVLTGMGADGTKGIKLLKEKKKLHVISQDEASSIVYGMPRSVAEAGLTDEVKPLEEIADAITRNTGVR